MVNNSSTSLDAIFSALSDPTRREMLARLSRQQMSVSELAQPFNMSKPAITKHLKVLENAGLLTRTIDGRIHHCRLSAAPLSEAADWLAFYEHFWQQKLDALEGFLGTKEE